MGGRYQDKIFRITYILLITITSVFVVFLFIQDYNEEQKRERLTRDKYYQRIMGENNSKFSVLQTHLNYIKTDERFVSFIEEDGLNYYNLSVFQKKFKETGSIFSNLGYSLGITNLIDDVVINFKNTSPLREYYKGLGLDMTYEEIQRKIGELKVSSLFVRETGDSIVFFIKDREFRYGSDFLWIVSLDKERFFNHFDEGEGRWYFKSENKDIVVSGNRGKHYLADEDKLKAVDFFKGEFYLENQGSNGKIPFEKLLFYILLLTGLWAGSYFIAIRLKEFFYRPVANLLEEVGGYDENMDSLEYMKNLYSGLQSRNSDLESRLSDTDGLMGKKKIKDYILGISSEGRGSFPDESYTLATLEFIENENLEKYYSKELALGIKTDLEIRLNNLLGGEFIEIDYKTISYVSKYTGNSREIYEEVVKNIEKELGISIIAGFIGETKRDELPHAYNESIKLIDNIFIYKEATVIGRQEADKFRNMSYYYPVKIETKFISKVVNGDIEGARVILEDILAENFERKTLSKNEKQELIFMLVSTFKRIRSRLRLKEIEVDIDLQELLESGSYQRLKGVCEDLLKALEDSMKGQDNLEIKDVGREMMEYIERNYSEDITLDTLADHMGHSLKYTSYLFKKLIGENFKYTLNRYRVDTAKRLMNEDPKIKIKVVSKLVGFNSDNTFIRIFKKYEGISPGKYN